MTNPRQLVCFKRSKKKKQFCVCVPFFVPVECVNPLLGWDALLKTLLWYFCLLKGLGFLLTQHHSTPPLPCFLETIEEPLARVHTSAEEKITERWGNYVTFKNNLFQICCTFFFQFLCSHLLYSALDVIFMIVIIASSNNINHDIINIIIIMSEWCNN